MSKHLVEKDVIVPNKWVVVIQQGKKLWRYMLYQEVEVVAGIGIQTYYQAIAAMEEKYRASIDVRLLCSDRVVYSDAFAFFGVRGF